MNLAAEVLPEQIGEQTVDIDLVIDG